MTPRERVLAAVQRRTPDLVPKMASFTPHLMNVFKEKTGAENPDEYFNIEIRSVGFRAPGRKEDFSAWLPSDLPEGTTINSYGVARMPGSFYHFFRFAFPLERINSLSEIADYPWPDWASLECYEHLDTTVASYHARDLFVRGSVGHIFEDAWQIRGYENLMTDFVTNQELAAFILDKITEDRCFMAKRLAEAGVDMLLLGDDVAMQDRMMMSPETWREWFKPRMARVIQAGKAVNPRIHIFYHSDGAIQPIIEDLIEVGVDVLNPVQPECMDPAEIKKQYGDRLAFWGTIGTQTTMPFGTPDEVRAVIKERIETVGKDGGLVLAPTHVLEPDVPWENVLAFFEAIEEYGRS